MVDSKSEDTDDSSKMNPPIFCSWKYVLSGSKGAKNGWKSKFTKQLPKKPQAAAAEVARYAIEF